MIPDSIPAASPSLARLIQELNRLPGIGPKSAQRLAYYLIRLPNEEALALADAISAVKSNILFCNQCQNLTDSSPCSICAEPQRNQEQICIVEDPMDVLALERTHAFRGLYHVLHGVISPLNGVGPDQLKLKELFNRLTQEDVKELIIATNPTLEGEATAMYIRRHLAGQELKITHLARGLPVGGSLEYTDDLTLSRAFQGRQEL
ncbi:MAG TPA: recombination protein RecR [Dehalococcoidia bacterium]|mgnify:FL=1|jgi:recombination protein RecR|uniref:Recombination protein RecR n=1 Tax=hydrothermal vent metagenome TaxID=652676 RepID=A0A160VAQ6_9ZZZZ|nr:recombination protein RecR [Dehalococcoidia bacterium]HAI08286.1 recombination protein RecR [Dehalococcoidia bacterium]HAJ01414.1 recombination protein RecR [Dehalococcoidia bacterium]|tara:strand:- start:2215 stop:2829 length:615 start_codon:yes stop_codon:yes gene_type:complete